MKLAESEKTIQNLQEEIDGILIGFLLFLQPQNLEEDVSRIEDKGGIDLILHLASQSVHFLGGEEIDISVPDRLPTDGLGKDFFQVGFFLLKEVHLDVIGDGLEDQLTSELIHIFGDENGGVFEEFVCGKVADVLEIPLP